MSQTYIHMGHVEFCLLCAFCWTGFFKSLCASFDFFVFWHNSWVVMEYGDKAYLWVNKGYMYTSNTSILSNRSNILRSYMRFEAKVLRTGIGDGEVFWNGIKVSFEASKGN